MVDREKIIKGLELCNNHQNRDCTECPYNDGTLFCADVLMRDALALLKEREAVEPRECQYPHGTYACGFCDYIPIGNKDGYRANYCPECGKAVKWDD